MKMSFDEFLTHLRDLRRQATTDLAVQTLDEMVHFYESSERTGTRDDHGVAIDTFRRKENDASSSRGASPTPPAVRGVG